MCSTFALVVVAGCEKGSALPPVPPEVAHQVGEVEAPPTEHVLLYPTSDAEALLGREIKLSGSGGWTIADGRAPGCEVRADRVVERYTRTYEAKLDRIATFSAGYGDLLGIAARFGSTIQANVEIENHELLRADLRGRCGQFVIDGVRIGTGSRALVRSREQGAEAGGAVAAASLGAGAGKNAHVEASIAWATPQAYAFTYRRLAADDPLELTIDMPSRVSDGEDVHLRVTSNADAWLVVFFLEANGRGRVLFPSDVMPEARIGRGSTLELPPLTATLRNRRRAARETIIVYAFTEQGDYARLRPPKGDLGERAGEYAVELTRKLDDVPMARWTRETLTYVIEPGLAAGRTGATR